MISLIAKGSFLLRGVNRNRQIVPLPPEKSQSNAILKAQKAAVSGEE